MVEGSGGGGGVGDDDEVGDEMDGGEERGRIARYDQRERERVARKQSTAADGRDGQQALSAQALKTKANAGYSVQAVYQTACLRPCLLLSYAHVSYIISPDVVGADSSRRQQ